MEGRLLDSHGEMLTKFDKDAAKGGDIITVGKALEAANVNIDGRSGGLEPHHVAL